MPPPDENGLVLNGPRFEKPHGIIKVERPIDKMEEEEEEVTYPEWNQELEYALITGTKCGKRLIDCGKI